MMECEFCSVQNGRKEFAQSGANLKRALPLYMTRHEPQLQIISPNLQRLWQ